MTSEQINSYIIYVSAIGFLLQFAQLLINKDEPKIYKRITLVGWLAIIVFAAMIFLGQKSICINKLEKEKSDSISTDNTRKIDSLTRSIEIIYSSSNARFNKVDSELRPYQLMLKDYNVTPVAKNKYIYDNSTNITTTNQSGGQNAKEINNNYNH